MKMRKRLTFEEAANLGQKPVIAPARLPNHGDVNGNPVYKQFMRLTQVYEEDELKKRQDDMAMLYRNLYPNAAGGASRGPGGTQYISLNQPGGPGTEVIDPDLDGSPLGTASATGTAVTAMSVAESQIMGLEQRARENAQRQQEIAAAAQDQNIQDRANQLAEGFQGLSEVGSRITTIVPYTQSTLANMSRVVEQGLQMLSGMGAEDWAVTGLVGAARYLQLIGPAMAEGGGGVAMALTGAQSAVAAMALANIGNYLRRAAADPQGSAALRGFGRTVFDTLFDMYNKLLTVRGEGQLVTQQQYETTQQQLINRALQNDPAAIQELRASGDFVANLQVQQAQEQAAQEQALAPAQPPAVEQVLDSLYRDFMDLFAIDPEFAILSAYWARSNIAAAVANMALFRRDRVEARSRARNAMDGDRIANLAARLASSQTGEQAWALLGQATSNPEQILPQMQQMMLENQAAEEQAATLQEARETAAATQGRVVLPPSQVYIPGSSSGMAPPARPAVPPSPTTVAVPTTPTEASSAGYADVEGVLSEAQVRQQYDNMLAVDRDPVTDQPDGDVIFVKYRNYALRYRRRSNSPYISLYHHSQLLGRIGSPEAPPSSSEQKLQMDQMYKLAKILQPKSSMQLAAIQQLVDQGAVRSDSTVDFSRYGRSRTMPAPPPPKGKGTVRVVPPTRPGKAVMPNPVPRRDS